MKLCKTCFPILSESIDKVSEKKSVLTLDHEVCENCNFSHNDMARATERLRATNHNIETFEQFVDEQLQKTKKSISFDLV